MNILYFVVALVLLVILGYPYLILAVANRQQGVTRIMGQLLSGLFVFVLLLLIVLYQTGVAQLPSLRLISGDRPGTRMMRGMSGWVTGAMLEDEQTIDEFISLLKANPELYEKFRGRLR